MEWFSCSVHGHSGRNPALEASVCARDCVRVKYVCEVLPLVASSESRFGVWQMCSVHTQLAVLKETQIALCVWQYRSPVEICDRSTSKGFYLHASVMMLY